MEWCGLNDADAQNADAALVWHPPAGRLAELAQHANLKVIISLGQGVDHLLSDPTLPVDIPIVRLVDPHMAQAMSHWVTWAVLDFVRDGAAYRAQSARRLWQPQPHKNPRDIRIAVYGIGAIGATVAAHLRALNFAIAGWSRRPKTLLNIPCHTAEDGWRRLIHDSDIHVCLLPLTAATRGLFNRDAFAQMKRGAYFINGGRGAHVCESALLAAINSGRLAGAALDVTATEPLPADSPLWSCRAITLTPHIAAPTAAASAAPQVARAIRDAVAGITPHNTIDRALGY